MDCSLLSPREVAQRIGVCRETVYRLIKDGQLHAVRFGGSIRVPSDQITETIARKTTSHGAAMNAAERSEQSADSARSLVGV